MLKNLRNIIREEIKDFDWDEMEWIKSIPTIERDSCFKLKRTWQEIPAYDNLLIVSVIRVNPADTTYYNENGVLERGVWNPTFYTSINNIEISEYKNATVVFKIQNVDGNHSDITQIKLSEMIKKLESGKIIPC